MKAEFPEKLAFLFEPHRYKVAWGGRGGAKSWGYARALLIKGAQKPMRILCARETQKSITDSVHKLLSDQVVELGLEKVYEIQQATILGKNGTEIIFAGLRQNIMNLKSYESVDICWVEEAQTVSKHSWDVLVPTIRKDGSEIWISFNPELETDETWKRFVLSPPPTAKVCRITYKDNPWFPDVLRQEMEYCRRNDPDSYDHVWEGMCIQTIEGAVYKEELRKVDKEGRITHVPYSADYPCQTFWDIGDRFTSIWVAQKLPFETRLIDYVDGEGLSLKDYLKILQQKEYVYSIHNMPHDAQSPQLGTGKSIEEQMRGAGYKVKIVPRLSLAAGISAARQIFPNCWFDSDKCADGIQALRHYRWAPDGTMGQVKRMPLHDFFSHGADAFRYMAVAIKNPDAPVQVAESKKYYVSEWS